MSSSIKLQHDRFRGVNPTKLRSTLQMTAKAENEEKVKIKFDEKDDFMVMELSDVKQEMKKLKEMDYQKMKTLDDSIIIDPSLKLGTGDDELVDSIVSGAKSSLGGIGSMIPDQMVTNTLKGAKLTKREKKVETRNYVSKTRSEM